MITHSRTVLSPGKKKLSERRKKGLIQLNNNLQIKEKIIDKNLFWKALKHEKKNSKAFLLFPDLEKFSNPIF